MSEKGNTTNLQTGGLRLAYLVGTYPALTTTFIAREVVLLQKWGIRLQVFSIRRPPEPLTAEQRELQRGVVYLLPVRIFSLLAAHLQFAFLRPGKYFGMLFYLLTCPHPDFSSRLKTFLHFGEGVYLAHLLRREHWDQIHAHFVDRAATLAMVASALLDVPYSVTAHANDIYVAPVLLPEKLARASFVATCTGYNKDHLSRILPGSLNGKVKCIYHGLDLEAYRRDPRPPEGKPVLISVGQLKEKKGFAYLLQACRLLKDAGYDFECQIVGEGPLRDALQAQIRQLCLEDTVMLCGALPHPQVIEKYRRATLFVLSCVLGGDGDRDGIPNVILEAMAMELPVVSTRHSGIPEVVEDEVNGLLVPPADGKALAVAVAKLLDDPARGRQYGTRGRHTVLEKFDLARNVKRLLAEFVEGKHTEGWQHTIEEVVQGTH
jgi:glycosyltransferase involved in cell wall biosynthesis